MGPLEVRRGFWRSSAGTASVCGFCAWRRKLRTRSAAEAFAEKKDSQESESEEWTDAEVSSEFCEEVSDHTEDVDVEAEEARDALYGA